MNMWVTALEAVGVTRAVDAPVLASTAWWPNMPEFLNSFAPRLRSFTQHRYGLSACSHIPPTPDALMHVIPTWTTVNDSLLLAAVSTSGLPFVIGEGNSVSCNGTFGVSDVFASALYAIDASLSAIAVNATSFKWHGVGDESDFFFYQPIYYKTTYLRVPNWDEAEPRPMFLGLWAFSDAVPAGSVLLNSSSVNSNGSDLLRAWALLNAEGTRTTVIILHKDSTAATAHARVQSDSILCKAGTFATLTRLTSGAGGLSARSGSQIFPSITLVMVNLLGHESVKMFHALVTVHLNLMCFLFLLLYSSSKKRWLCCLLLAATLIERMNSKEIHKSCISDRAASVHIEYIEAVHHLEFAQSLHRRYHFASIH